MVEKISFDKLHSNIEHQTVTNTQIWNNTNSLIHRYEIANTQIHKSLQTRSVLAQSAWNETPGRAASQRVPPPRIRVTMVALSAQVAAEVATSGATRHSLGWPEGQRAREPESRRAQWPDLARSSHRVLPLYNPTPAFVQTKGNPWSEYKCCDRTSNSVAAKTEKPSRGVCDTASSHEREIWYLLQGVFQKKNWPHISLFPKSKFFFFWDIL